jgi:predicted TIM-barrel fold metal-dependent hydrolase
MTIRADDLTPTIAPPDPNPKKPRITLPPKSCDSHFHVFGPHSKFPYAANRSFTPTDAPKEDLFRLHEFLGFQRGVFVQSTCHGSDHRVLVDLLDAGKGNYRGVALLEPWTPQADVDRLDDAGVRGVRLHFLGTPMPRADMLQVIEKVSPHGWHIALHVGGHGILDLYEFITSIEAPVVIDHIGRIDVAEGLQGKTFSVLRRLLDRGNVWVKLSGTASPNSRTPMPTRCRLRAISPPTLPSAWSGAPTGRIRTITPCRMMASWSISLPKSRRTSASGG